MKYIFQFARILGLCLAGELLHDLLPWPIPASVYGLVLLLAALKCRLVRLDQVRETAHFLTGIFLLLFIPGTVAIIEHLDILRSTWLPLLIALIPVTVLVFAAAGLVSEKMIGGRSDD